MYALFFVHFPTLLLDNNAHSFEIYFSLEVFGKKKKKKSLPYSLGLYDLFCFSSGHNQMVFIFLLCANTKFACTSSVQSVTEGSWGRVK